MIYNINENYFVMTHHDESKDYITGNKLIANFMGYTYFAHNDPRIEKNKVAGWKTSADVSNFTKINKFRGYDTHSYLCRSNNDLKFHKDMNWLHSVVSKIEHLNLSNKIPNFKEFIVTIKKHFCLIWLHKTDDTETLVASCNGRFDYKIDAMWDAVIQFIKYYNNLTDGCNNK